MRTINREEAPLYLRPFTPDFWAEDVADVDFQTLSESGITAVAFDADSTLLHFGTAEISEETRDHLAAAHEAGYIDKVCIATNRRRTDLGDLAASLGATVVYAKSSLDAKPWPRYFERVQDELEVEPEQCAMIGDKVFVDIFGGNRHGFNTVLVEALGEDSALDRLVSLRRIESKITRRYQIK